MKASKFFLLLSGLLFIACENKDLFPPCGSTVNGGGVNGDALVKVDIHWDGKPVSTLPGSMRTLWYLQDGKREKYDKVFDRYGGYDRLPASKYTPLCFDYYGNDRLDFRISDTSPAGFEVYNIPAVGLYSQYADPVPGEPTVAEAASPYLFYVDSRPQTVDTESLSAGDTLTVHFYPENAMKEFTFMIYGVKGAENMVQNAGAISGMSASYFPVENRLASAPSTILFQRVEAVRNGQTSARWTETQKAMFTDKNPNWQSADTTKGWTGDWITGKFSTFGPVDVNIIRIRLTVEALSSSNYYYYGAWGYWRGQWEDTVAKQIRGALEGNGVGSPEERQAWWRAHNGGFDVVLYNDGRLNVPAGPGGQNGDGFQININEWITIVVPVE